MIIQACLRSTKTGIYKIAPKREHKKFFIKKRKIICFFQGFYPENKLLQELFHKKY